jgi:large subunit ribosomal protein L24
MAKQNIIKGDKVKVIAGSSKGTISNVLAVYPKENKVLVEGVNVVKRHTKPTSSSPSGSIVEKELPIHISNVMLVTPDNQVTRVRRVVNKAGKSERISVKTGKKI